MRKQAGRRRRVSFLFFYKCMFMRTSCPICWMNAPVKLSSICSQLCDALPLPLSDSAYDCRRLASSGVILYDLTVALENFCLQHCDQTKSLPPEFVNEGGLCYSCGLCCLNILDILFARSCDEAAADLMHDSPVTLPADPIVRIATSFISQLLCHTAVVPACDPLLAQSLGGSSAMPPSHCNSGQQHISVRSTFLETRWRLWKLQRDAVILLLKCAQSPILPHVTPTLIFIISGALQVLCGEEGRPSRRRQDPGECDIYGCSESTQGQLQTMLTGFIFEFDSDSIIRALLQLVCTEQPPWLLLPLQSFLSRLIIEHNQLAHLIDIMSDSPLDNGDCIASNECDRDIVQDILQLLMARPPRFASDLSYWDSISPQIEFFLSSFTIESVQCSVASAFVLQLLHSNNPEDVLKHLLPSINAMMHFRAITQPVILNRALSSLRSLLLSSASGILLSSCMAFTSPLLLLILVRSAFDNGGLEISESGNEACSDLFSALAQTCLSFLMLHIPEACRLISESLLDQSSILFTHSIEFHHDRFILTSFVDVPDEPATASLFNVARQNSIESLCDAFGHRQKATIVFHAIEQIKRASAIESENAQIIVQLIASIINFMLKIDCNNESTACAPSISALLCIDLLIGQRSDLHPSISFCLVAPVSSWLHTLAHSNDIDWLAVSAACNLWIPAAECISSRSDLSISELCVGDTSVGTLVEIASLALRRLVSMRPPEHVASDVVTACDCCSAVFRAISAATCVKEDVPSQPFVCHENVATLAAQCQESLPSHIRCGALIRLQNVLLDHWKSFNVHLQGAVMNAVHVCLLDSAPAVYVTAIEVLCSIGKVDPSSAFLFGSRFLSTNSNAIDVTKNRNGEKSNETPSSRHLALCKVLDALGDAVQSSPSILIKYVNIVLPPSLPLFHHEEPLVRAAAISFSSDCVAACPFGLDTLLTAVLEPMVRILNIDDDIIVRRAAASALLFSLRPYNVDNAKTVAIIAGANLRLSLRALWLARTDRDPFLRDIACAAWGELEHLRSWDRLGLGEGRLIQELP